MEAQGGQVPRVERITQGSRYTSHPSGERSGGMVQEVVQFVGVFGQSGCSLAVGEGNPGAASCLQFRRCWETRGVRCERWGTLVRRTD